MSAPRFGGEEGRTVALLPWGNVIEDFLDALDISLEQFCQEMDGGWLFGYVEALKRRVSDLRLILIGTGADADGFRALLQRRRMPGVEWIDEYVLDRDRMGLYLSAADVYAFPSRHEGFPLAPLEAMACGLPLIAADAPGVPAILARGEEDGGIVVPREDAGAFAGALAALLDDPERARTLGARGRRRVEQSFSLAAVGRRLREFLFAPGGSGPRHAEGAGLPGAPSRRAGQP